jgi:hypothetical protein
MRGQGLSRLWGDVARLRADVDVREAAAAAGPPLWQRVQALLADPTALAARLTWDDKYLGSDSPDRIDFTGMNQEERIAALRAAVKTIPDAGGQAEAPDA